MIETSTTQFAVQCYELYKLPPLGSLVKTRDTYGIVYNAVTTSLEPGRRPIARGKDETSEDAIYQASPQLTRLLRSEFGAVVVGHRQDGKIYHYLPPNPARIHAFVYLCQSDEVNEFSHDLDFLNILISTTLPISSDELIAAALRQMSRAHEDSHAFLVTAGRELATLLSHDFSQLKSILGRFR